MVNPWMDVPEGLKPDRDGRVLGPRDRAGHRPVPRRPPGSRVRPRRDRGTGLRPVPDVQLPRRPGLAADPPVRRLRLARGRAGTRRRAAAGSTAARRWPATGRTRSSVPEAGRPPITYDWYRDFIQTCCSTTTPQSWFAPLITFGEIAVGLGLIVGVLTGFAAFFGSFMNMSFMLAGSASTNPVMFALADRPDPRLEGRRLLRRRPLAAAAPRDAVEPPPPRRSPPRRRHPRRLRYLTHRDSAAGG